MSHEKDRSIAFGHRPLSGVHRVALGVKGQHRVFNNKGSYFRAVVLVIKHGSFRADLLA